MQKTRLQRGANHYEKSRTYCLKSREIERNHRNHRNQEEIKEINEIKKKSEKSKKSIEIQ